MNNINEALDKSYKDLFPLSKRWLKEKREHINTLSFLHEGLEEFKDKKILDIGSGLGIVVHALNLLGAKAEGIDKHILKEWGLEGIRKEWDGNDIKTEVADFFESPFVDKKYNAIISENVIEHLPYRQKEFLEKIYNLLEPNGIIVISTPNLATFLKQIRFIFGRSPYWDFNDFFLNGQPYGHFREFTKDELLKMAELVGFGDAKVEARNTYFKKQWIFNAKKFPKFLSWFLSEIFPSRRDTLYLIAKK